MPKSKFFRVAVEGATSDGRAIDRKSLMEMAETYNAATYLARVNLEHIRGITPDGPFQAYGDVLSIKTEEIDLDVGGKTEKRLALYAEIDALDPLVAMNRKRQKIFSSIEIQPNFANTGKAYLVGLAVTDSPASLGTEMLQFAAAQGDKNPLAGRKLDPANVFTEALETSIELVEEAPADPTGLFASMKSFFDRLGAAPAAAAAAGTATAGTAAAGTTETTAEAAPAAGVDAANFAALAGIVGQLGTTAQAFMTKADAAQAALSTEVAKLTATIEGTAATGTVHRTAAHGQTGMDMSKAF